MDAEENSGDCALQVLYVGRKGESIGLVMSGCRGRATRGPP